MHTLLKISGISAWIACLLTLSYQGISWMLLASWPSLSLMDATASIGINLASLIQSLPLEYAMKAAYVFSTTELSLAFWWLGTACFILAVLNKIFLK